MAEENINRKRKRKRKNSSSAWIASGVGEEDASLDLCLAYNPNANQNSAEFHVHSPGEQEISNQEQEQGLVPPTVDDDPRTHNHQRSAGKRRERAVRPPARRRRNSPRNTIIPVPYPWATDRRARIHDLETLLSRNIEKISGEVECSRCERQYQMEHDLREKSFEVLSYFMRNMDSMHDRAPRVWMNPVLSTCNFCKQENSVKPIISKKKKSINWLFLLLGQALGFCSRQQLRYFCKYTKNHRTGAKDRILYLTYLTLCRQLYPGFHN